MNAKTCTEAIKEITTMFALFAVSAVYGAVYGGKDVTDKVISLVRSGTTTIQASNSIFGDPWYGTVKSLSITFGTTTTVACREHESVTLPNGVVILGAAYGSADVTATVRNLYNNGNKRVFLAENSFYGDPWYGTVKSFSIVYARVKTLVAREGSSIHVV